MSFEKVKEFIELAKSSGVSELKFESGDDKFYVKVQSDAPVVMSAPAIGQAPTSAPVNDGTGQVDNSVKPGLVNITSPFVGTFYRSSSPDADPYVKIGDKVSKGQPLCIVEAMKIMNEIESESDGEIVEICVENETYVEFGQVLFRVKA